MFGIIGCNRLLNIGVLNEMVNIEETNEVDGNSYIKPYECICY